MSNQYAIKCQRKCKKVDVFEKKIQKIFRRFDVKRVLKRNSAQAMHSLTLQI